MTDQCPVCNGKTSNFLSRYQVPVHQNLVFSDQDAAQAARRGDLVMQVCESCGFVYNRSFDLSLLAYGGDYNNNQTCSPYFDHYLDGLVEYLVEKKNIRDCRIVEVGCGQSAIFLKKMINYPGANNTGMGFDPSYTDHENDLDGRLVVQQSYYDESCTDVPADVVICRHVIEHVPDPVALLSSIRLALSHNPKAKIFFETPCVDWILSKQVVWDLFYEHCSLFNSTSLRLAFELSGFSVVKVDHVFGGQYLWLEAELTEDVALPKYTPVETSNLAMLYGHAVDALIEKWKNKVRNLQMEGPVALWGAGAKGATLACLIDNESSLIDCIVDLNPEKQGCFLPGTAHQIVSPAEIAERKIKTAILMNPNYREENLQLITALNLDVDLIDLDHHFSSVKS